LALAFPPFNPPSLPRAAAARLMAIKVGDGGGGLRAASTICEATMLMSVGLLLERLGIQKCTVSYCTSQSSPLKEFQTDPLPGPQGALTKSHSDGDNSTSTPEKTCFNTTKVHRTEHAHATDGQKDSQWMKSSPPWVRKRPVNTSTT
jgi:hypothetical protein